MFIHLHTHSYYSFLTGLASPAQLAQSAVEHGMEALALTDRYGLSGAVEFYTACRSAGVRPILGLELNVAPPPGLFAGSAQVPAGEPGSLVLLAMDLTGWSSLCHLSSALLADPGLDPARALPFERLAQDTGGLLCLTGGLSGLAAKLCLDRQEPAVRGFLLRLAELFSDRLYVEVHRHTPADVGWTTSLASQARRLGLPLVATHPLFYLKPEQAALQRVLAAIRLIQPLNDLPPGAAAPPRAFFASSADLSASFAHDPAAVAASLEVASRCRLELPLGVAHFPELPLLAGQTALDALRRKAEAAVRRRYPEITPPIQARLDHELAVIGECGYASLFLIMEEIVQYARQSGVPIASRGSAASSLVAHCLGITTPDPLRLNLYFERFLNPARATPPDIDTDLCSRRRDKVIRFVYDRFGADRVAMVCTVSRFRRRSALREVAKAYRLPSGQIKTMVDSLPQRWWGPPGRRSDPDAPFAELAERYDSPLHQAIFRDAAALLGIPHHLSVHPGGVVIAPGPLVDLAPTQMAAKGILITQFDLESIERIGLVKIDLLGIRGLTVLGDVAQSIQDRLGSGSDPAARNPARPAIDQPAGAGLLDVLEGIPEDDPLTAEMVRSGRTIGCFQIESPGMRATLKEIQAHCVDDIMIALALYRPGPLTGGLKDAFVRRHRGQEPASHLHPALAAMLEDTYGVILYQEQVLRIAHELAGLSLADADLLRRAMSHFDPGEQMKTLKAKFIAGALERNHVEAVVAERIWELMAAFAGYGFPKAHAASYAQIGWRAAWCKSHHPAVFMAAVLANWGGYYGQRVYLTEARRLGLAIRPPDINHAQREFSVSYLEGQPVLFMGLDQVRDLARRTQGRILQGRPFHSLADFLTRVDPLLVEAENLARAGALADFGRIPVLLEQLRGGSWRGGQLPLFPLNLGQSIGGADWSLAEKVSAQQAVLGVSLAAHPLELVADALAAAGALTTVEAAAQIGRRVRVAGMRQTWMRSLAARGEPLYFMSLEDLEGMLEVVILSDVYRRHRQVLSGPGPYIVEGVVEMDPNYGEPVIRAERFWQVGG